MTTTSSAPVGQAARGGATNLVGSLVYGAANFVLLVVLNRLLGAEDAGIVLVAIALFSILSTVGELGSATGLVRMLSRERALERPDRLRALVMVAVVPVLAAGVVLAAAVFVLAEPLADLLADGEEVALVRDVLRAMALFLPTASLHSVVVQGTRGFDTMRPQVLIERIGRASALPLVVAVAVAAGMGPVGVGVAWAATNLAALVLSVRALHSRVLAAEQADGRTPAPPDRETARRFWAFTAPRAVGQTAEVTVSWVDTILVGILVSTTMAGVYASGTRYLLPGLYAALALTQVAGPLISGLVARNRQAEASELLKVISGWQTLAMWPIYLVTAIFPVTLLRVFGEEAVAARGALVALSLAMLAVAPLGPVASVILMAGRSRTAMANTLLLAVVNIGGNLLFVPGHGITAAGIVWAVTLLLAAALPAWQSHHLLGISTLGRPALVGVAVSAATIGGVGLLTRLVVGDRILALLLTGSVGLLAYAGGLWAFRSQLHLKDLSDGIRSRS